MYTSIYYVVNDLYVLPSSKRSILIKNSIKDIRRNYYYIKVVICIKMYLFKCMLPNDILIEIYKYYSKLDNMNDFITGCKKQLIIDYYPIPSRDLRYFNRVEYVRSY